MPALLASPSPARRFALLGALLALGCPAVNRTLVDEAAPAPESGGESIAPSRSFEQHGGSKKRAFRVVRTRPEWDALWRAPGVKEGPRVDFSEQMILAAFAGRRPTRGHSLRIERISRVGDELRVEVAETAPAPGCPVAAEPSHPFHLLAVPRWEGTVRFRVRTRTRAGCLAPPEIGLSCRVASPEAWRSAGPTLHPAPGDEVRCEAAGEGIAVWTWKLLGLPEGSEAKLSSPREEEFRLRTDLPGDYLLGVHALSGDGQASLRRFQVEAGEQTYEVVLEADEPEGALGLRLEVERLATDGARQEPGCATGESAAPGWCARSESGYEARIAVAAGGPRYRIRVARAADAQPSATVSVRLGEWSLARLEVPSDFAAWTADGTWEVGVLDAGTAELRR